jgi:tetratricopeptide (TPR) repeat protein
LLDKALAAFEKLEDREWQAKALMRLGWLSQERKNHKQAAFYLERAVSSAQEIESETLALECQSYLIVSKLALHQTEEAQALAEKMARRLEGSPPGYYLVAVNYRLYQAFCALGQSKRAEGYLKRAYDDLLELYLGLKNEEFRKSFWHVRLHRQVRRA